MDFKPLQGLTDKEAPVILELRAHPTVGRITGGEVALSGPKQIQQMEVLPPGTAEAGLSSTIGAASQIKTDAPLATKVSVQPATEEMSNQASLSIVDTGFGSATSAKDTGNTVQTVSDTGEPEESDADLDARIASLIKTD